MKGDKDKNLVPFRKADRFDVFQGKAAQDGKLYEGEKVGLAFLRPGAGTFRLKLWAFPNCQYFVAPDDKDSTKYTVLSLDEYQLSTGEIRTNWNRIGEGSFMDNFIRARIYLLSQEFLICLFPNDLEINEDSIAS